MPDLTPIIRQAIEAQETAEEAVLSELEPVFFVHEDDVRDLPRLERVTAEIIQAAAALALERAPESQERATEMLIEPLVRASRGRLRVADDTEAAGAKLLDTQLQRVARTLERARRNFLEEVEDFLVEGEEVGWDEPAMLDLLVEDVRGTVGERRDGAVKLTRGRLFGPFRNAVRNAVASAYGHAWTDTWLGAWSSLLVRRDALRRAA